MKRINTLVLLVGLIGISGAGAQQKTFRTQTHKPKVAIPFNRLHDYKDLVGYFRKLVRAYPQFLSIHEIGKSSQGRPLYVIKIHNPKTGPEKTKSGMFIDANIHGNEVQGGDACLYTAWYLMEYYGKLKKVTELVDQRVFYINPVTNVDGRVWWFNKASTPHWPRSGLQPYDNDRDGRLDEDGHDDLNRDGTITQMRKRVMDGTGTHRLHPKDPRLMVRVGAGEKGDYIMLGSEGIDNDGDGRVNEDPPGGYDMNRNWPSDWQPRYVQYGAGAYPLSHPETRAVALYVLARPNIAGYQSYHNAGGMILRGPGSKQRPRYQPADIRVYDRLGQMGEKMLPFYRYMIIWKDLYNVHGGEVNWAAEGLGVISFTNELWTRSRRLAEPGKPPAADVPAEERRLKRQASETERLKWDDRLLLGETFVPWRTYEHPAYGTIEIGGYKQMQGRVPPSFLIEEMLHRNTLFTLLHADSMPLVTLLPPTVKPLGGGLYQVDAVAVNGKLIPTRTSRMMRQRIGRRDLFSIRGKGVQVLAGGTLTGRVVQRLVPKEKDPGRIWHPAGISSHGRVKVRWIVRGTGDVRVTYDAEKGGRVSRVIALR